jgi:CMP/dCMP kinase
MKIAIDGPSGSGKSTISKAISRSLTVGYLDTGAMYRAATAWALNQADSLPIDWVEKLDQLPSIEVSTDPDNFYIKIDSKDVTQEIRTQRVTDCVSQVSAHPKVRSWMVDLQRNIMNNLGDIVMEGRDIATVVMPEAEVKIFVTADLTQRALRRAAELEQSEIVTQQSLINRDTKDSAREISPLKKDPDAIELDTSLLTVSESVDQALSIVQMRLTNG